VVDLCQLLFYPLLQAALGYTVRRLYIAYMPAGTHSGTGQLHHLLLIAASRQAERYKQTKKPPLRVALKLS
jgi:hypothetical protein